MTDTTAQLRQKLYNDIKYRLETVAIRNTTREHPTLIGEDTDNIMQAVADYISQLELPTNPNEYRQHDDVASFDRGYKDAIDEIASTLQKAVEALRSNT